LLARFGTSQSFVNPQERKLTTMDFLLGALFGFSTAIGGIWWLLYLLGSDKAERKRMPDRRLSAARALRPNNSA
jgi:hypothetical protein